jgi:hypothetical protein
LMNSWVWILWRGIYVQFRFNFFLYLYWIPNTFQSHSSLENKTEDQKKKTAYHKP